VILRIRYIALVIILQSFGLHGFANGNDTTNRALSNSLNRVLSQQPLPVLSAESDYQLKPAIGFGLGNFTFIGDVANNNKGFHPTVSRIAWQLRVTHPLNSFLELEFHTIFGKVSANERSLTRNLNFETRIRMGGINLAYNFDHILSKRPHRHAEPFFAIGIESFEFLAKTDLYDRHGNMYHYWSDGSIRNLPEDALNASDAIRIYRDYKYETDIRELNSDGFGKYPERAWAVPVSLGATFYVGGNFKLRFINTMHFTSTDYIDGVSKNSTGARVGNKGKDKLFFASFYVSYDLQPIRNKEVAPKEIPNPWEEPLFAKDTFDMDRDGVPDFQDACPWTPPGVAVDMKGCPLDLDNDRVPDHRDDELPSPTGKPVNDKGVALTFEDIQMFWNIYYDTTGQYSPRGDTVHTVTFGEKDPGAIIASKYNDKEEREYVIILDEKKINVAANELHKYLGYRDFKTITEGNTIYYVIGGFKDLASAKATKQDLDNRGIKNVGIGESTTNQAGDGHVDKVNQYTIDKTDASQGTVKTIVPDESQEILYRVQIAAFTRALPNNHPMFVGIPDVVQIKGADGIVRYYSGAFKSLEAASKHKIIMAYEKGYKDAFVVALRGGNRISLSEVTELTPGYNEGIAEYDQAISGKVDESKIRYRVQLGEFSGDIPTDVLELYLSIGSVKPVTDERGVTKYLTGDFQKASEAEKHKDTLRSRGIANPIVVGDYLGRIMSLEEVIDLLKNK
jgi:hypothetical protein